MLFSVEYLFPPLLSCAIFVNALLELLLKFVECLCQLPEHRSLLLHGKLEYCLDYRNTNKILVSYMNYAMVGFCHSTK